MIPKIGNLSFGFLKSSFVFRHFKSANQLMSLLITSNCEELSLEKPLPNSLAVDFEAHFYSVGLLSSKFSHPDNVRGNQKDLVKLLKERNSQSSRIHNVIFRHLNAFFIFNFIRFLLYFLLARLQFDKSVTLICLGDVFYFIGNKRFMTYGILLLSMPICFAELHQWRRGKDDNCKWLTLIRTLNGLAGTSFAKLGVRSRADAMHLIRVSAFVLLASYQSLLSTTSTKAALSLRFLFDFDEVLGSSAIITVGAFWAFANTVLVFYGNGQISCQFCIIVLAVDYLKIRFRKCTQRMVRLQQLAPGRSKKLLALTIAEFQQLANTVERYDHFFRLVLGVAHYVIVMATALFLYLALFADITLLMRVVFWVGFVITAAMYTAVNLVAAGLDTFLQNIFGSWSSFALKIEDAHLKLKVPFLIFN